MLISQGFAGNKRLSEGLSKAIHMPSCAAGPTQSASKHCGPGKSGVAGQHPFLEPTLCRIFSGGKTCRKDRMLRFAGCLSELKPLCLSRSLPAALVEYFNSCPDQPQENPL
jgi:hypothetical protein